MLLTPAHNHPESRSRSDAFERGLAARGWNLHNLKIMYRSGLGEIEPSRLAAKELLDFAPVDPKCLNSAQSRSALRGRCS